MIKLKFKIVNTFIEYFLSPDFETFFRRVNLLEVDNLRFVKVLGWDDMRAIL
jgi:hypothetical protein